MGNQLSSQGNVDTLGITTPTGRQEKMTPQAKKQGSGFNLNAINGNDYSCRSSRNAKNHMNMIISLNNDSGFFKDNVSSYKGVKTDASSASGNSSYEKESTNDVTGTDISVDARELRHAKVQTNFEWKEGGSQVYLTGSFCNWNQKFLMTQNVLGNKFEINLVRFFSIF
jgi:hypothetical protein